MVKDAIETLKKKAKRKAPSPPATPSLKKQKKSSANPSIKKIKKKTKPAKSKERRKVQLDLDALVVSDDDPEESKVFESVASKTKAKAEKKLSTMQTSLQQVMGAIKPYIVGRTRVDPALLLSPPKEYAARILYPDHLQRLYLHFITGGEIMAQKDFILFMENVSAQYHTRSYFLFLGDPRSARRMAKDAPRDCLQRRPHHRESGDDHPGALCLWWPPHPENPEETSNRKTPTSLRRCSRPPQDVVRLARTDRWATCRLWRICSLARRLFRV
jgi:hypothetical protein